MWVIALESYIIITLGADDINIIDTTGVPVRVLVRAFVGVCMCVHVCACACVCVCTCV